VLRLLKYANENNLFRKSAARETIYLARIFYLSISRVREISAFEEIRFKRIIIHLLNTDN